MGLDLITLAEYKTHQQINSTNFDREIGDLIPRISEFVKQYCRTTFIDYVDDSKVEVFDAGFKVLLLSELPVIRVSSVEYSEDYGTTYTELVEFRDWVRQNNQIRCVHPRGYFPELVNGYRVTYNAGYETVPADVKLACFDLLSYYRQNNSAVHSPKAPGTNSVQIEYISSSSLPASIKRILDLYRADWS